MSTSALEQAQLYAEQKAAEMLIEAKQWVGVDDHADVFVQGKLQAYRDMAKYLAQFVQIEGIS